MRRKLAMIIALSVALSFAACAALNKTPVIEAGNNNEADILIEKAGNMAESGLIYGDSEDDDNKANNMTGQDKITEAAGATESANTEDINMTEVVAEPPHKPAMGFSFSIPQGWTYDISYAAGNITATLRPEGINEGEIVVEYYKGFGVCGTGLVEEVIDFNGVKAYKGFYDGNKLWSFITLRDDYRDCVVLNQARDWYELYEEDINLILASIRFKYYE